MKKTIKYFAIILLMITFYQTYNYYKNNDTINSVTYYDLKLNLKQHSFSKNKNYILYFDPDCSHCSEILKKIPNNKRSSIILITPNKNINSIKNFIKENNIDYGNVLIDIKKTFAKDLRLGFVLNIPTLLLIDNNKVKILLTY
jgi:thioredoxin-related protein